MRDGQRAEGPAETEVRLGSGSGLGAGLGLSCVGAPSISRMFLNELEQRLRSLQLSSIIVAARRLLEASLRTSSRMSDSFILNFLFVAGSSSSEAARCSAHGALKVSVISVGFHAATNDRRSGFLRGRWSAGPGASTSLRAVVVAAAFVSRC